MISSYLHTLRASNRNVRLALTIGALMGFTLDGGVYSVLLNLFVLRLGYGPEFVGQANSIANLVFAFSSLAAGWLGGRYGDRRLMIAGVLVMLIGTAALPASAIVAPNLRPGWLVTSLVATWVGLALYFVNANPFLLKATPRAERGSVFGLSSAAAALASFAGVLLGGLLPGFFAILLGTTTAQAGPYGLALLVVALLMIVALLAVLRTTPAQESPLEAPAPGAKGAPTLATAYGLLVFMSVVRFLQVAAVGSGVTFFNVYMDDALGVATAQIGLIASLARLVAVPAALFGPLLSRRIGYGAAATAASFVTFLSVLPLALIPTPTAAGVGFLGLMASTSIRYPAFYVYMMERTPPGLRATMTGAGEMAAGLCFALMSLLGGYMIVRFGYPSAFLLGGAFTLAGTLLFAYYVRTRGEAVAVLAEG